MGLLAPVPPRQPRSRQTLDALATAAERLLRDKPFEDISMAEICSAAGVTTGAFYARFASKDALMPLIYQRYRDWLAATAPARFDAVAWEKLNLQRACEQVGRILVEFYEERPWLLRAVVLFSRLRPEVWANAAPAPSNVVLDGIKQALAPHVTKDADAAVRFAAFAAMSAAREAVLFANAPMVRAMKRAHLARDIGCLMSGYLQTAGAIQTSAMKRGKKK